MLTPQEVAEHAFAKASFGGYNMSMVDEFLDMVTADYTALYKENAVLKSKMKVLADKIEEYRSTEDAMRKALMSAQRVADQMVSEAEQQKAAILAAAEREAKNKITSIRKEAENERMRLAAAQNSAADYLSKLKDLCRHEMEYLSGLSQLTAAAAPPPPDPAAETAAAAAAAAERAVENESLEQQPEEGASSKDSLYQQLLRNSTRRAADPPASASAPAPQIESEEAAQSTTRRIDFNHLQFGKDYTIE